MSKCAAALVSAWFFRERGWLLSKSYKHFLLKEVVIMTKYREIIRLTSLGFSQRDIMASCGVAQKTVVKVQKLIKSKPKCLRLF